MKDRWLAVSVERSCASRFRDCLDDGFRNSSTRPTVLLQRYLDQLPSAAIIRLA